MRIHNVNNEQRERISPPLSPSFKQNAGSFFQKQKAQSNKMALTPTKQRLIRASSITNMFDLTQMKEINEITNKASISTPMFDCLDDSNDVRKQLSWKKPGESFEVW